MEETGNWDDRWMTAEQIKSAIKTTLTAKEIDQALLDKRQRGKLKKDPPSKTPTNNGHSLGTRDLP